ncbi:MAG TPA: OmpA family protein, partial [Gammaproteobacteria bacterium]|nr:OmpA family protein [Gammaproteobacteria bacterium]
MNSGQRSDNPAKRLLFPMLPLSLALLGILGYTNANAGNSELYAGVGVGAANLDPDIEDPNINYGKGTFSSYKVLLGYDLTNNISVEGVFAELGHIDLENTATEAGGANTSGSGGSTTNTGTGLGVLNPPFPFIDGVDNSTGTAGASGSSNRGQLDYRVYGLQSVIQFPNNLPGFSAFAKLGIGQLQTSANGITFDKTNDAGVIGGLGAEYQMVNGFSLRAAWEYFDPEAQMVSLDLVKRFGRPSAIPKKSVSIDADNDGVDDHIDRCPHTPPGVGVGVNGCEMKAPKPPAALVDKAPPLPKQDPTTFDADSDGVIDNLDLCLNTPPGATVDNRGCTVEPKPQAQPEPEPEPQPQATASVADSFSGILEGVNFLIGSAKLTGEAKSILNTVAHNLNDFPGIRVTIIGHTDNVGDAARNKRLSEARALAVAEYLASQGVDPSRMRYAGKG